MPPKPLRAARAAMFVRFSRPTRLLYNYSVMADFRWNDWNLEHATRHGVSVGEAESVVANAGRGWPRRGRNQTWMVHGRGTGDRMVEVVYVIDDDADARLYVIHAMPLTTRRRRGGR
jgi:hypothetical protein